MKTLAPALKWRLKLRFAMGDSDMPSPTRVVLPGMRHVTDPTRAAFLNAIAEHPEDDAPKLVMADWLEENGEELPAQRMRWYVQALRTLDSNKLRVVGSWSGNHDQTPHDARIEKTRALHQRGGNDALNVFDSLYNRILQAQHPVNWGTMQRGKYSGEQIRRNTEGVHLANEMMSLGVMPKTAGEDVMKAAELTHNTMLGNYGYESPIAPVAQGLSAARTHAVRMHTEGYIPPDHLSTTGEPYAMTATGGAYSRSAAGNAAASEPHAFHLTESIKHHSNGQIGAGLASHPIWGSFPGMPYSSQEPYALAMSGENRLRTLLRLPLKLESNPTKSPTKDSVETPPSGAPFTTPERQYLENPRASSTEQYHEHIQQINDPKAKPWSNVIPHVDTLTTLAQLGSPAKGEYEHTYNAVKQLFGHDQDGITAWLGLNGAFSPNTSYKDHAGAASMITAAWLNAGKPTDEHTIKQLIHAVDTFGKHYTAERAADSPHSWGVNPKTGKSSLITAGANESFGGTTRSTRAIDSAVNILQNVSQLRDALQDPTGKTGENLAMLGGGGTSKVPNFVLSYLQPFFGSAVDTHMARLILNPTLDSFQQHSDILRQVRAHLSKPGELDRLEAKSLKGLPVKSELVRVLMRNPNLVVKTGKTVSKLGGGGAKDTTTIVDWLKEMNTKLIAKPQHYLAYKYAINEAAKRLGWKPAEVQESVWTGILGLLATNQLGIPHKEVMNHLTNDALRKGWQNHEAIYFPQLVDALRRGGANPATLRKLGKRLNENSANSSRPGILPVSNVSSIPDIAAHLPGASVRSAARPIIEAMKAKLEEQGLIDPATGKYRLRRVGEPMRLAIGDDEFSAMVRGALANKNDQAPHLIMSDWLADRGMSSHAGHVMMSVQQNPNEVVLPVRDQIKALLHDPSGYGDLVRFLVLHAGRFAARKGSYNPNHRNANQVILMTAPPPERTKIGGVKKRWFPELTSYTATFPSVQEADEHHANLIREGAIGVHRGTGARTDAVQANASASAVTNWPERNIGEEPHNLQRPAFPIQLMAKYDAPLDFGPVQDRVLSSNQQPLIEGLRQALQQSGVIPHTLTSAIHDYAGQARASIVAIGQYANPNAPATATAWMGLLGRQPGMLAFKGSPQGKDSIYHFTHHNADIVRNVLQENGVFNRTIVPQKSRYDVYVYDPGNKLRGNVAKALGMMRASAVEWRGDGEALGGDVKDMGRAQYRNKINESESAAAAQPQPVV